MQQQPRNSSQTLPILHPRVSPKHFHPKTAHPTDVRALLEGQAERETEAERGAAEKEGERVRGEKERRERG